MALVTKNKQLKGVLESVKGKTYTVTIITVLIVLAMISFAIVPAYTSIANQLSQNDKKRIYLADLNHKNEVLKDLYKQETELTPEITLLDKYLPQKRNDEYFAANLDKLTQKYGFKMATVSFGTGKAAAGVGIPSNIEVISVAISLEGDSLIKLNEMIVNIENMPAIIKINTVSFSQKKADDKSVVSGRFSINLQMEYYLLGIAAPQ